MHLGQMYDEAKSSRADSLSGRKTGNRGEKEGGFTITRICLTELKPQQSSKSHRHPIAERYIHEGLTSIAANVSTRFSPIQSQTLGCLPACLVIS